MKNYFTQYRKMLDDALTTVDTEQVQKMYNTFANLAGYPVYIFGNGGSAAIADHFCCDFNKGIYTHTNINMRAMSLNANGPLLTAIANDSAYNQVFAQQLKMIHDPSRLALAIAVSSSGNSPNIMLGLDAARELKIDTIALVGFDGGHVKKQEMADTIVHVESHNYGIVEDAHMAILHSVVQKFRRNHAVNDSKL